jgi:hypothetical protein
MHTRPDAAQLLDQEPPARRRLQRHPELLTAETLNEPTHPHAMRRRYPRPADLARRRVQPPGSDLALDADRVPLRSSLGASSSSTVSTPARTSAALELRRSLHAGSDGTPAAHAIYQVTPGRPRPVTSDTIRASQAHRPTASMRVSSPPGRDHPLRVGHHRQPESKLQASKQQRVYLAGRTSSRHERPRVMQERCWRSGGRCVAGSGRRVRWSPRRG